MTSKENLINKLKITKLFNKIQKKNDILQNKINFISRCDKYNVIVFTLQPKLIYIAILWDENIYFNK